MVTFTVVENYSHEHKFEDFSKDYNDGMSKKELVKKYDIPKSVWHEWKERLPSRPFYRGRSPKQIKIRSFEDWKIKRNYTGTSTVFRRWKGNLYSYGTFPSLNIAIMVQERLCESKWDTDLAIELIQNYGVTVSKKCLLPHIRERDSKYGWND